MFVVGVIVHFGVLDLWVVIDQGLCGFASSTRGNRGNVSLQVLRRSSVGRLGKSMKDLSMDIVRQCGSSGLSRTFHKILIRRGAAGVQISHFGFLFS